MSMRCKICNSNLLDLEAVSKYPSGEYKDTCIACLIKDDESYDDDEWARGPVDDDLEDVSQYLDHDKFPSY